uniref:Filensin n=1 Tax=Hucho hucho TaxID=62062 RepID=A0A4W5JQJ6_9TELE
MYKTSYLREVRKEKYERSDVFEEPYGPDASAGTSAIQGWESLQELNSRFARYINRARVLEQRNSVFRKQLETLQRMEEASGLEEAFTEQIGLNRQRISELSADRAKLEHELKDACRMLDEFTNKYRNECEYQEQLRGTLEQLNKEADHNLLRNLEFQIQSQFLQDDINSTKDRHRKVRGVQHTVHSEMCIITGLSSLCVKEQEKQLAQRRVPALQSQLEEYKSALCQLQAQKQHLQYETSVLESSIKSTQESYDDEIQLYNEQIESLRKDIEEAERSLEKYTNECRHLAMYQTSLENELERYKRIIENEDNRLNSAIIGTPITLFTTNYRYTHTPTVSSRGRDITQAIQDITSVKPRQKNLAKKVLKKEIKDVMDSGQEERVGGAEHMEDEKRGVAGEEGEVKREVQRSLYTPQDVPDGAQISKAFDTLCNIVRDRMRKYKKPEPIADFYTKGRYVLVTGDGSYLHPHFYTSSPSAGHVFVTIRNGMISPHDPFGPYTPSPNPPHPQPMPPPGPRIPTPPSDGEGGKGDDKGGKGGGKGKYRGGDPEPRPKDPTPPPQPNPAPAPGPDPKGPSNPSRPKGGKDDSHRRGPPPMPSPCGASSMPSDSMSYEKVEMVESVERFSNDRKTKGYEETAMVVETMIEKTSKKKN